jgi:ribosome-associated protein
MADAIVVLHVGPLAFFTDYFVIATGRNERQIRAIAEQIKHRIADLDHEILGVEGGPESGWVLIDLGTVVVHLFGAAARQLYDLELLWGESNHVDWRDVEPLTEIAPSSDRL